MKKFIGICSMGVVLSSCGTGGNPNPPVQSIQAYTSQLQQINMAGDHQLNSAKSVLLNYYTNAQVEQSISYRHTIVDCVPFLQQPALINASDADKNHALELFNQSQQQAQNNVCESGYIAITRIPLRHFANGNKNVFWKNQIPNMPESATFPNSGYKYYQSESQTKLDFNNNGVFVAIDSGESIANMYLMPNQTDNQHYIQQEWLASGSYPSLVTLETGVITANFFIESADGTYIQSDNNSINPTTKSVFIFSTPNSYNLSTPRGNQVNMYNLQGGFIQLNNLIIFGAPLSNEKYNLIYVQKADGYHLLASVITLDKNGNYHVAKPVDVGYWPMSHYTGFGSNFPTPNFDAVTAGFEMENDPDNANSFVDVNFDNGTLIGYGLTDNNGFINSFANVSKDSFAGLGAIASSSYQPNFISSKLYDSHNNIYDITIAQLHGHFIM